jgi:hypothetical protein
MIVNFQTYSDHDYSRTFILVKSDGVSPIALAGSSMQMMIRKTAESPTVLIELATANNRITMDFLTIGKFTIFIPVAELKDLTPGIYVHSLIRTDSDLIKHPVWRGTMTHSVGPTR